MGVSRREATCQQAVARGVVTRAQTDFSILAAVDIVFVCTPLAAILPTVEQLTANLPSDAIITDVGSVKSAIVASASPLWPHFIGGHPMAGNEQQGIAAGQRGLFIGAPYVLTPTATTLPRVLQTVSGLARSLGSQVITCSPEAHDRAVAWVSHLPVMVSASLIAACLAEPDRPLAQRLASSGFRDTSRVGGGNPELGVMMARYNRSHLRRSLLEYRRRLDEIIDYIEQEDWQSLEALLQVVHQTRTPFL